MWASHPTEHCGTPPPSATVPLTFQGRLLHSGSLEKGAGSRRLTEGLLRKSFTPSKRFHKESLHRLAAVPLPFQGRLFYIQAPSFILGSPLGHPQGVPCAELSPQVTEGYFRETYHIKQKIPQGTPPPSATVPLPFQGRLLHSGSLEKGAGSRRLTEGLLRKSFTPSKRFHKESLHRLAAVPLPFQGRLLHSGSPERGAGKPQA